MTVTLTQSLVEQLHRHAESARIAGANETHALLHTIEIRFYEALRAASEAERALSGEALEFVRALRATLTGTAGNVETRR